MSHKTATSVVVALAVVGLLDVLSWLALLTALDLRLGWATQDRRDRRAHRHRGVKQRPCPRLAPLERRVR